MDRPSKPSRRILVATTAIVLVPVIAEGGTGASRPHARPPAIYADALATIGPCLQDEADHGCITNAFGSFASNLAAEVDALPAGRSGLGAWLRLAAELHQGRAPAVPAVEHLPLREALEALYTEIGIALDRDIRAQIHTQIARLSPIESNEIADFVSAFGLSLRLAARARGDGGIMRWMNDPRRGHTLAMRAMRTPDDAPPEARKLLEELLRVDMHTMVQASVVLADALTAFDESLIEGTLDLPLVFIGGEGDTVHIDERLLLIDNSGNDLYLNNAGGGIVDNPVPDLYPFGGSFAADLGAGDDTYDHQIGAQGWAWGAVGILYDEGGSDRYHLGDAAGQGAGYAGVGALYDGGSGDDRYLTIWEDGELTPVATKGAALIGIGLLIDEGGSDVFRQDGLDGIAYGAGGGLGILASLGSGDDTVRSDGVPGLFVDTPADWVGVVQGNAEVDGVGILYEERGDERYLCNGDIRQGCQGTAGDSSLALLWDRAGDDLYFAEAPMSCDVLHAPACLPGLGQTEVIPVEAPIVGPLGQGAGYMTVPPGGPALGVLYDEGGDDRYIAPKWAQGYGALGNLGLLYDTGGGDDVYDTRAPLMGSRADGETWLDGLLGIGIDE